MKLTPRTVAGLSLPADKADVIFFDDALQGFGLRLRAGGSKTWIYQYRVGPRQYRINLGNAVGITPQLARDTAAKLAAQIVLGGNPALEKQTAKAEAEHTIGVLVEQYLKVRSPHWRPRTLQAATNYLMVKARPLHRLPAATVSQRNIANLLNDAAAKSGHVSANRLRASLCAFFAWVIREGVRMPEGNIAANTNINEEATRERVLTASELKAVWHAAGDNEYGTIVRLLILTGQRRDEIGGLQRDEIGDDAIVLPATRTKNGHVHTVPLSDATKMVLGKIPSRGPFVFGRGGRRAFSGYSATKVQLDNRLGGAIQSWRLHDIRRTVATGMADIGIQPHIIEAVLNHMSGHKAGVAGIYNRSTYDREKRDALVRWADRVTAIVEGRDATVVAMKRGA
jgi:integrase